MTLFFQMLMNVTKYQMLAPSSAPTALAHTYANVLRAMSKLLTIEPARNEMVGFGFGFVLHSVCLLHGVVFII